MAITDFLSVIDQDINDILALAFNYRSTLNVPNRYDTNMSFDKGVKKTGKTISSCVLYVDIRDSLKITTELSPERMGKLYTIFTKSVLKASHHHSGRVRNVIGDRVMIVFPVQDCFVNAVECAFTINHIAAKINKQFTDVNFKCGIGIDYGEMRVIRVGIHKQGHEGTENRNLVWVGSPANIASRLTDVANKSLSINRFKVSYNAHNPGYLSYLLRSRVGGMANMVGNIPPSGGRYLTNVSVDDLSEAEFADRIGSNHLSEITYPKGKFLSFTKEKKELKFSPIIVTEKVFLEYRKALALKGTTPNILWEKVENHFIRDFNGNIYQSDLIWKI